MQKMKPTSEMDSGWSLSVGDVLIRVSNDEFEFDDNKKEIFITKLD